MTENDRATELLRALAEPRRREILRLVSERELPAGAIAQEFDVTRTAVSQHLTVLRDAGLITERREGTKRLYSAEPRSMREVRAVLDDIWGGALARAKSLVEESDSSAANKEAG